MTESNRYAEALRHIPPDDYDTWLKVGMALRHEGLPLSVWEQWSAGSDKYEEGQCARKWESFRGASGGEPVTGGTIMELARQNGFSPSGSPALAALRAVRLRSASRRRSDRRPV